MFSTKSYFYDLPEELIAQTPIEPRDHSRLLVYHKDNNSIEHKHFYDIIDYFKSGDVLVVNNTKVLPARIYGKKPTGSEIEILLLKRIDINTWECLAKPGKRLKVGATIDFSTELSGEIIGDTEFGGKIIKFTFDGVFEEQIKKASPGGSCRAQRD